MTTTRDPLAPIGRTVGYLQAVVIAFLLVGAGATFFGSGSMLGFGTSDACVTVDNDYLHLFWDERSTTDQGDRPVLDEDTRANARETEVCASDASFTQRAVAAAPDWAGLALLLGFFWLTRRALVAARQAGLFTTVSARRTRQLGWFLLLGGVVHAAVVAVAGGLLVADVTTGIGWSDNLEHVSVPWTLLLVSAGVLTFARILERAVALQDDHDATI